MKIFKMISAQDIVYEHYGYCKGSDQIINWLKACDIKYELQSLTRGVKIFISEEDKNKFIAFLNIPTKDKVKSTCRLLFGVDNPFQSEEKKAKLRQTNLKRYGFEYATKAEQTIKKRKRNYFKLHGVINNSCLPEEKEQRKQRMIKLNESGKMSKKYYDYDNTLFDSSWELYYYIYQKDILHNKISRGKRFKYVDKEGIEHTYICDFLVNGHENVEIKGDHLMNENGILKTFSTWEENREKTYCMINNNVTVLRGEQIYPIIKKVEAEFPGLVESCKRKEKRK